MPRSEAQKAAQKRYYLANKDRINARAAVIKRERYNNDGYYKEQVKQWQQDYDYRHNYSQTKRLRNDFEYFAKVSFMELPFGDVLYGGRMTPP